MNDTLSPTDPLGGSPIKTEVHKVASLVDTARQLLAEGRIVDLSALEGKVRLMCDAIQDAAPEEQAELREPVEAVINALDQLEADLTRQYGAILAEHENSTRMAAMDAYRKAR